MKITRRGVEMNTVGVLPIVGSQAPALTQLIKKDWSKCQVSQEFSGKYLILNIFPSIDTPVCATTVRNFNKLASQLKNAAVLCISKDLPPALNKFCAAEGIANITVLSAYRADCNFGDAYGVRITDGAGEEQAFKDLFGRGLMVIDPSGKVVYSELVSELAQEPNYKACLDTIPGAAVTLKSAAEEQHSKEVIATAKAVTFSPAAAGTSAPAVNSGAAAAPIVATPLQTTGATLTPFK